MAEPTILTVEFLKAHVEKTLHVPNQARPYYQAYALARNYLFERLTPKAYRPVVRTLLEQKQCMEEFYFKVNESKATLEDARRSHEQQQRALEEAAPYFGREEKNKVNQAKAVMHTLMEQMENADERSEKIRMIAIADQGIHTGELGLQSILKPADREKMKSELLSAHYFLKAYFQRN